MVLFLIPYLKSDVSTMVPEVAYWILSSFSTRPNYHHSVSRPLDPDMKFRVPRGVSRRVVGVLHLLRSAWSAQDTTYVRSKVWRL